MHGTPLWGEDMVGAAWRHAEPRGTETTRPPASAGSNKTVSLFLFGALVAHAPFYSAQLGGLQNSDTTPYS
jgi:hypothetical protein